MLRPTRTASKQAKNIIKRQYKDPFKERQYGDIFNDKGRKFEIKEISEDSDFESDTSISYASDASIKSVKSESVKSVNSEVSDVTMKIYELSYLSDDLFNERSDTPVLDEVMNGTVVIERLQKPEKDNIKRQVRQRVRQENKKKEKKVDLEKKEKLRRKWKKKFETLNERYSNHSFKTIVNIAKRRLFQPVSPRRKYIEINEKKENKEVKYSFKSISKWNRYVKNSIPKKKKISKISKVRKIERVVEDSRNSIVTTYETTVNDSIVTNEPVMELDEFDFRVKSVKKKRKHKPKKIVFYQDKTQQVIQILTKFKAMDLKFTPFPLIQDGYVCNPRIHLMDSKFDSFVTSLVNSTIFSLNIDCLEYLDILCQPEIKFDKLPFTLHKDGISDEIVRLKVQQILDCVDYDLVTKQVFELSLLIFEDSSPRLESLIRLLKSIDVSVVLDKLARFLENHPFVIKVQSYLGAFYLTKSIKMLDVAIKLISAEIEIEKVLNLMTDIVMTVDDIDLSVHLLDLNLKCLKLNVLNFTFDDDFIPLMSLVYNLFSSKCGKLTSNILNIEGDENLLGKETLLNFRKVFNKVLPVISNTQSTASVYLLCFIGDMAPPKLLKYFLTVLDQFQCNDHGQMFASGFSLLHFITIFQKANIPVEASRIMKILLAPISFMKSEYYLKLLKKINSDDSFLQLIDPESLMVKDFLCIFKTSGISLTSIHDDNIRFEVLLLIEQLSQMKTIIIKPYFYEFLTELVQHIVSTNFESKKLYLKLMHFIPKFSSSANFEKFGPYVTWAKDHETFREGSLIYVVEVLQKSKVLVDLNVLIRLWVDRVVDRLLVESKPFKRCFVKFTAFFKNRMVLNREWKVVVEKNLIFFDQVSEVTPSDSFYAVLETILETFKSEKKKAIYDGLISSFLTSFKECFRKPWLNSYREKTFFIMKKYMKHVFGSFGVYSLEKLIRNFVKIEAEEYLKGGVSSLFSIELFKYWWSLVISQNPRAISFQNRFNEYVQYYLVSYPKYSYPFLYSMIYCLFNEENDVIVLNFEFLLFDCVLSKNVKEAMNENNAGYFVNFVDWLISQLNRIRGRKANVISILKKVGILLLEISVKYLSISGQEFSSGGAMYILKVIGNFISQLLVNGLDLKFNDSLLMVLSLVLRSIYLRLNRLEAAPFALSEQIEDVKTLNVSEKDETSNSLFFSIDNGPVFTEDLCFAPLMEKPFDVFHGNICKIYSTRSVNVLYKVGDLLNKLSKISYKLKIAVADLDIEDSAQRRDYIEINLH